MVYNKSTVLLQHQGSYYSCVILQKWTVLGKLMPHFTGGN